MNLPALTRKAAPANGGRRSRARKALRSAAIGLIPLLMLVAADALPAYAGAGRPQDGQSEAVGSLTSIGTVQVNGAAAAAQSAVFAGDSLNTEQGGTATLAISGRGTIKVYPQSLVTVWAKSRYLAELDRGTAVITTLMGASGVGLRLGDYVVEGAPDAVEAAAMVRLDTDGASVVTCISGSVRIVAVDGDTSLVLQRGQSTSLSVAPQAIATQAYPSSALKEREEGVRKKRHWGLIILGIGGSAAVAAAVVATGGGGASVSTSVPPSPPPPAPPAPAPPPPSPTPPSPTPPPPGPPAPPPGPPAPPPGPPGPPSPPPHPPPGRGRRK